MPGLLHRIPQHPQVAEIEDILRDEGCEQGAAPRLSRTDRPALQISDSDAERLFAERLAVARLSVP
jgi:hypothetical protein